MTNLDPTAARIFDRGYRRYEGERKGVGGAFFTLYLATLQRILGLRRGAKAKILPVMSIAIAYLPTIVFIGIAALFKNKLNDGLPEYHEYYGTIIAAISLFVAFVAPEALCPDRRHRILGIYLSSPLSRLSYVAAKLAAVFTVLCMVTIGPVLLLAVARTLLDSGPSLADLPVLLLRIVFTGAGVALFFSAISLAISSFTDRKAFASAGFILVSIVSQVVGAILGSAQNRGLLRPGALISTSIAPGVFAEQVFGKSNIAGFGLLPTVLVFGGVIVACLTVLVIRFRQLEVTR
jgi:ABC-2 type transport system permease protein